MTTETTSTVSFEYRGMDFTAHLTHMTDPVGKPHVEIDRIVQKNRTPKPGRQGRSYCRRLRKDLS